MTTLQDLFLEKRDDHFRQFSGIVPLNCLPLMVKLVATSLKVFEPRRLEVLSLELVLEIRRTVIEQVTANPVAMKGLWTKSTPHWLGNTQCPNFETWYGLMALRWMESTVTSLYDRRTVLQYIPANQLARALGRSDTETQVMELLLRNVVKNHDDDRLELFALAAEGVFRPQEMPEELPRLEEIVLSQPVRLLSWAYSLNPNYVSAIRYFNPPNDTVH